MINHKVLGMLAGSWLSMILGLSLSLSIITDWEPWEEYFHYLNFLSSVIAFGGYYFLWLAFKPLTRSATIRYDRVLWKVIVTSLLLGIAYTFSVFALGYLWFPLQWLCWSFMFVAIIYFGVRILRLSKEMNKQSA